MSANRLELFDGSNTVIRNTDPTRWRAMSAACLDGILRCAALEVISSYLSGRRIGRNA